MTYILVIRTERVKKLVVINKEMSRNDFNTEFKLSKFDFILAHPRSQDHGPTIFGKRF